MKIPKRAFVWLCILMFVGLAVFGCWTLYYSWTHPELTQMQVFQACLRAVFGGE